MLEYLRFSIPISVGINASADIVWDTLTDIRCYPSTFDSVLNARKRGSDNRDNRDVIGSSAGGAGSSRGLSSSRHSFGSSTLNPSRVGADDASSSSAAGSPPPNDNARTKTFKGLTGSRWKVTRISVVEHQQYSANVTVTQCAQEGNKRSFTLSTHQMLGATCSLKFIVEPVKGPPNNNHNNNTNPNNSQSSTMPSSPLQPPPPAEKTSSFREPSSSSMACCQVTAIMTMIPYQIFVKLLGVLCCICLLKFRARMAMERDLEDLANVCEERQAMVTAAAEDALMEEEGPRLRPEAPPLREERTTRDSSKAGGPAPEFAESDAAGGVVGNGSSHASKHVASDDHAGLRIVVEEDSGGC